MKIFATEVAYYFSLKKFKQCVHSTVIAVTLPGWFGLWIH